MPDINDLIKIKLKNYPPEVIELALAAINCAEKGMPESSITDYLENVVRQIVRKKEG